MKWIIILLLLSGCSVYDAPDATKGTATLHWADAITIAKNCGNDRAYGCALVTGKACFIWISTKAPDWVLNHEEAHCEGWRHPE